MDVHKKQQFAELVTATCRRAFIVPSTPATGKPSTMLMLDLPVRSSNQSMVAKPTCQLFMQVGQAPVVLVKLSLGGLVLGIAFNPMCEVTRKYLNACAQEANFSFTSAYLGDSYAGLDGQQGFAMNSVHIDLFSGALAEVEKRTSDGAELWSDAVLIVMTDFLLEGLQRQVDDDISDCRFFVADVDFLTKHTSI